MCLGVSMALQSTESKTVLNNRGDSKHPCLTPFLIVTGSLNAPLYEILQLCSLYSGSHYGFCILPGISLISFQSLDNVLTFSFSPPCGWPLKVTILSLSQSAL
jgi:hypothetical protein